MKLTPWMLTIAAFLIIAALAVGFLFKKLFAATPEPERQPSTRQVPMATSDIAPGTVIERAHLGMGPWRSDDLTPDTILSIDSLVGRIVKEPVSAATPLQAGFFYPTGQGPEFELSDGKRAVAVNVGESTEIVNGLVKPGDFVDVFLTVSRGPTSGRDDMRNNAMTLKLFDGVKVLAINGRFSGNASSSRSNIAVLELDSKQQESLVLARNEGNLSLTFNPDGPGPGGLSVQPKRGDRLTLNELLRIEAPEQEPDPFLTEQYRGGDRRDQRYDKDGNLFRGRNAGSGSGGTGSSGWWTTSRDDEEAESQVAVEDQSSVPATDPTRSL